MLAGCGTTQTYKAHLTGVAAKPADYPIPLYTEDMRIPRPCDLIGELAIGDTAFTISGGSAKGVMTTLMDMAHAKGADVVQVVSMKRPDFESAHYRIEANLLRYADHWETAVLSENDFVIYLQRHRQTLDPIEGIWSDGSAERVGIIRNTARPGREFLAFTLNPLLPSWQPGYKKMELAHEPRPGAYSVKYYANDFEMAKTSVRLDHDQEFNFIVHTTDAAYEVVFIKIGAPLPLN